MIRLFSLFASLVLALFAYATYTGAGISSYSEIKDVPKSIRNNPGVYRTVYTRYPHK
jgi:hypothetical protein